jgi:NAD(P)-dependent dehydrogenase (short-subunit alcohol dehydrogenase family)/3-oxoacyl-(acyl-carrier-protein) synthase
MGGDDMDNEFAGKIVLVTGGGRGIGRAVSLAFARRGAHLIVNYFHSEGPARNTVADAAAVGGSAELHRASVGRRDTVEAMFAAVRERHGRLDVLVNNATYGVLGTAEKFSDEDWTRTLDVNLHGVRWCIACAVPLLEVGGGGAVVNISSLGTQYPSDSHVAVAAAKAAQDSLTRYLAADLGPTGIRVNTVTASMVDNHVQHYWPNGDEPRTIAADGSALGRKVTEIDVAEAVVFLASESARCVTGTTLLVDGGTSLRLSGLPRQLGRPPSASTAVEEKPAVADPPISTDRAVAVVGLGLVLPGVNDAAQFWAALGREHNAFGEPTLFDLDPWFDANPAADDKSNVRVGGFEHDFTPHPKASSGSGLDHTGHYLRHCLAQAMDGVTTADGDRFGCYFATWSGGSVNLEEAILAAAGMHSVSQSSDDAGARRARVSALLAEHYPHLLPRPRMSFPDMVVRDAFADLLPAGTDWLAPDTACSSSLYAIDLGVKKLLAGERDIVFCGGGNVGTRRDLVMFSKIRGLSLDGEIRAFDVDAHGVLFSDAAAVCALKRLDRATADGDKILGVLGGFGGSTDGAGSTIAPAESGQRLAVLRARAVNATDVNTVDWVVGHGTGTPLGDLVELRTLDELADPGGHLCTSNKPLVGHAGWASGAASVAHILLALQHERIPAQRYFSAMPTDASTGKLRVPVSDVPWAARPEQPRIAGVSAFGLGGTNGHLLVHDHRPDRQPPIAGPETGDEDLVLIGWRAHLPGALPAQRVRRWVRTGTGGPNRSFGERYPLPKPHILRLPPVTATAIDRTHLMAIAVADEFVAAHGELWQRHRDRTGVITGHMGPTRSMIEYTIRAGATDLTHALSPECGADEADVNALTAYLAELTATLPPANEQALAGQLANIISTRVANRFGLHGMTMAVDAGHSSTQAALHVAQLYLSSEELDVALVLGINGNSTPIMAELAEIDHEQLAEGAVLLALTRASLAAEQGWPVLARLRTDTNSDTEPEPTDRHRIRWGERPGEPTYLGADGALAVLRALESGRPEIEIDSPDPGPRVTVYPAVTRNDAVTEAQSRAGRMSYRSVVATRRQDIVVSKPALPAIPPGAVVLVDSATTAAALADRDAKAGATILCTDPTAKVPGVTTIGELVNETDAEPVLARLADASAHVRVVAGIRDATASWPTAPPPRLLRLQEWLLLVIKRLGDRVHDASVAALLFDPLAGHTFHPHLTLLTGFVRSLALEIPCPTFAVVTDATMEVGLGQLAAESAAQRDRPVVMYRCGARYVEQVCPAPLPSIGPDRKLPLDRDSVVVAVGGGRGITAVALGALAWHVAPKIWLLGTTELGELPADLLAADGDDAIARARAAYLTDARARKQVGTVAEHNRRFDRLLRVREITRTLQELRELCGEDRVRYLVCDVGDPDQVRRAANTVGTEDGRVDLLIHAAGRLNSSAVASKSLVEFRATRTPKVNGYHNLKSAFAVMNPRLWCNFGSTSGLRGYTGDTDYSPANEYLSAAARHANLMTSTEEFTINWGLWAETGMACHVVPHLSRQYDVVGMDNDAGARLFLAELASPRPPDPTSYYGLGQGWSDSLFARQNLVTVTPRDTTNRQSVLLDEQDRHPDGATWTWRADPERDSYLREHLIDGRPAVPAVIMLAMAAEAAVALCPETTVTGFADFRIEAPIYADPDRNPPLCRVHAEIIDPDRIRVSVTSDIVAKNGRTLRHDRTHCTTEVLLGSTPTPPPHGQHPAPRTVRLADDTSMRPDIPVQLSGVWRTLYGLTADSDGAHARWYPRLESDGIFATLPIPALLIDSMARLITYEGPGLVSMFVPLGIDRIDLHVTTSDAELANRHRHGLDLSYEARTDEFIAVSSSGEILVRVTGVNRHIVATAPIPITYPEIPVVPAEPMTPAVETVPATHAQPLQHATRSGTHLASTT